jgi:hypothetical protein
MSSSNERINLTLLTALDADTQPTVVHNGQDGSAPPKRGRPSQQEPGKVTAKRAKAAGPKQQRAGRQQQPAGRANQSAGQLQETETRSEALRVPADSLEQPATVPKGCTAGSGLPAKAAKAAKQPAKRARQATEASDRSGRGRTKAPAQGTAVAAPEPLSDAAAANAEIMRAFGGLGRKRGSAALSGALARAHGPAGRAPAAALQGNALPSPIATQQLQNDALQQRTSKTRAAAAASAPGRYDLAAKLAAESAKAAALDSEGAPPDATMANALDVPGQASPRGTRAPAEAGMGADRSPAGNAAAQKVGGPAGKTGGASAVRAAGDVLGQQQSAVKSAAAAKDGSMCDLLNPNNPLYDPAFALEYAQIRWGALIPAVLTPCRYCLVCLCLNIRLPLANAHRNLISHQ